MKKILIGLVLLCGFSFGIVDSYASDLTDIMNKTVGDVTENALENIKDDIFGEGPVPDGSFQVGTYQDALDTGITYNTSVRQYILRVVNFFLAFVGLIGTVMLIYGGFVYITTGSEDGSDKGKKIIMYSVIGILVILVSFALVNTLITQAPRGGGDEIGAYDPDQERADMTELTGEYSDLPVVSAESSLITATGENIIPKGDSIIALPLESAEKGITFTFENGPYSDILWDFGDGTPSKDASPIKKYGQEEYYIVTVMGVKPDAILTATKKVLVGGVRAKAKISNISPQVGEKVSLNGKGSQTAIGQIDEYNWSCSIVSGDGECFPDKSGGLIDVVFLKPGEYEITLMVKSSMGLSHESSSTIQVLDVVPQATFQYSQTNNYRKPGEYRFDARGSRNMKGQTSGLTYVWNFDGEEKTTTSAVTNYEFQSDGDKTVQLYVVEKLNGNEFISDTVEETILDVKTFGVDFNVPNGAIYTDDPYTLSAESQNTDSFEWTLPGTAEIVSGSTTDKSLVIKFSEPGRYDIVLRGLRGSSISDPIQKTINVLQKTIDDMSEEELREKLKKEGLTDEEIDEILKELEDADTDAEKEDALKKKGVSTTKARQFVRGTVLSLIEVIQSNQRLLSGAVVFRGENGYPEDLEFNSQSYDTDGDRGALAELDETWSVDGNIIMGGAADIPMLLTEVKTYRIQLKVSDPNDQNINDTYVFSLQVQNKEPQKISKLRIDPVKKKAHWRDLLTASSVRLQVNQLNIEHDTIVTLENLNNFRVVVKGVDDIDGGFITKYTFYLKQGSRLLRTKIISTPEVSFNLEPFIDEEDLYIEVLIEDNDKGATLLESTELFSVPPFTDDEINANSQPLRVEILLLSQSNQVDVGERIRLQANAEKNSGDSFNNNDYEWTIDGMEQQFRKNSFFIHEFDEPGEYTVNVKVSLENESAEDSYMILVTGENKTEDEITKEETTEEVMDALEDAGLTEAEIEEILNGGYTKGTIRKKLRNAGLSEAEIEEILSNLDVIEDIEDKEDATEEVTDALEDAGLTEAEIEAILNGGYTKGTIRKKLRNAGLSEAEIEEILSNLDVIEEIEDKEDATDEIEDVLGDTDLTEEEVADIVDGDMTEEEIIDVLEEEGLDAEEVEDILDNLDVIEEIEDKEDATDEIEDVLGDTDLTEEEVADIVDGDMTEEEIIDVLEAEGLDEAAIQEVLENVDDIKEIKKSQNQKENLDDDLKSVNLTEEERNAIMSGDLSSEEIRIWLEEKGLSAEEIEAIISDVESYREHSEEKRDRKVLNQKNDATCESEAASLLNQISNQSAREFLINRLHGCDLLEALNQISTGIKPPSLRAMPSDIWDSIKQSKVFKSTENISDLMANQVAKLPSSLYLPTATAIEEPLVYKKFQLRILGFWYNKSVYQFDWKIFAPDGTLTEYKNAGDSIIHIPMQPGLHRFMVRVGNANGYIDSELEYFKVMTWDEYGMAMPPEVKEEARKEQKKLIQTQVKAYVPIQKQEIKTENPIRITPKTPEKTEVASPAIERQFRPAAPEIQKKMEQRPMTKSGASSWILSILTIIAFLGGGLVIMNRRR